MVRCVSLRLCLLAGACLLAHATPLPPSPGEEGGWWVGRRPRVAQAVTGSGFVQTDSRTDPAPVPVVSSGPPAAPDGLSQSVRVVNGTGQPASDSLSLQLRAGDAWPRGSGRAGSAAVSPTEQEGVSEGAPALVESRPGGKRDVLPAQTEGNHRWADSTLNRTGGDRQGPTAGGSQSPRSGSGSEEGPGQESSGRGGPLESPSEGTQQPAILSSPGTAQDAQASQPERAGAEDTAAIDTPVLAQASTGTELEPTKAMIQTNSETPHDLPSPSPAPQTGERGTQAPPQMSVVTQMKGSDSPGVQGQTGERGNPTEKLLSMRGQLRVQEDEKEAKTAKALPTKQPSPLNDGVRAMATASALSTANATAMPSITQRSPSSSSTPSSEETELLRQTADLERGQPSTPSLSNMQKGGAFTSPSVLPPRPYLTASPLNGRNAKAGSPVHSGSPEETFGPTPTEPPQEEHPGSEQGVTAHPSTGGPPQQAAVVGTGSTPTSTSPDPGPSSASSETAGIEAGAGGEHPAMEGTAPRQGVKAAPTPEDLPLIFEPVDDALSEVMVTAPPGGTQQVSQFSVITAASGALSGSELESKVTASKAPSPSEAPFPAMHDGPLLSWQMSGTEMMDTFSSSLPPSLTAPPPGPPPEHGILDSEEIGMIDTPTGTTKAPPNPFETQQPKTTVPPSPLRTVAMATTLSLPSPKSGLEELEESQEEHDDEEEEDTTESEEGESKADSTEVTTMALMSPTYSHIPYHFHSGSVWVQRNQGLAHSWVEKIRDKAGYVSGMLAPVGIGIAGALFILGALYSIKVMHRKRRSSYKRQRRKHKEMSSRQDRVMLLADSSEDEF
ncbi:hypothetical protein MATL_G00164690 [Megalops atlanticus]|uniref:Armadillo-like helical domain-containing protein 4 n=1 Tax=Megalops atlanticus TaxID=7932 RepID=A0A9D3PW44_MEGAT|nr:hypothetical protein MATL_G00164690 [Megalops atlanticus]